MRLRLFLLVLALVAMCASCKKRKEEAWPASMRSVAPSAIATDVHAAKGSAVLFVLYASWCHSCREELPDIEALADKRRADGLKLLAYSLDEDPGDFSEMLRDHPYRFDLVRLTPPGGPDLTASIHELGGTFRGSIPYAAVFGRDGRLVAESTGASPDVLERAVTKALE